MRCFVCEGEMAPYFTKDFSGMWSLKVVDCRRCGSCGMTVSKTHHKMSLDEWRDLNLQYHSSFLNTEKSDDDPRWLPRLRSQEATIAKLARAGILPGGLPWVDYGSGDGKLVEFLGEYGLPALKFEHYASSRSAGYLTVDELHSTKYSLVSNTSVFERARSIQPLDEIAGLVADSGVLALHVLVCESIPQDPTWFYLLPVHCAFFTNRSMQILFDRWKFEASIYHLESRMWFGFKRNVNSARAFSEQAPRGEYYFKEGFMDYWK